MTATSAQLPMAKTGTYEERLLSRYEVEPDGCWRWTGTLVRLGYGQISRHGRNKPAHVAMYEHLVSPVPAGLVLDHTCHNDTDCSEKICKQPKAVPHAISHGAVEQMFEYREWK